MRVRAVAALPADGSIRQAAAEALPPRSPSSFMSLWTMIAAMTSTKRANSHVGGDEVRLQEHSDDDDGGCDEVDPVLGFSSR